MRTYVGGLLSCRSQLVKRSKGLEIRAARVLFWCLLLAQVARAQTPCLISITTNPTSPVPVGAPVTVTVALYAGSSGNSSVSASVYLDGGQVCVPASPDSACSEIVTPAAGSHTFSWSCTVSGRGQNSGSQQLLVPLRSIDSTFFGMHLNSLSDPNRASLNVPFGTLRLWGIEGTAWFGINSAPGSYDWTTLDAFLDWAQTNNYAVIYTFGAGPCWVSPSSCQPNPDHASDVDHIADWDNFVTALVSHAKGRIKYYELWNEPTVNPYFWSGTIDLLAQMGQHAFQIIKSNDPNALVLTPSPQGDATGISQWMDRYLTAVQSLSQGTNPYADGIAFHSYEGAAPENVMPVVQQLQMTVSMHGLSLPLFDTEGSWGTSENLSDMTEQAAFVGRSYALQASMVDRFAWYGWDYCLPGPGNCWGAMWKRPGVYIAEVCPPAGTFCGPALLESGMAYGTVSQWLIGAQVTACLDTGGGVWSCPIWRPGGYQAQILWSTGTDPALYTVPAQFTESRDLLTNCPRPIQNQALTLGHLPILVETSYPGSGGSAACWWEALQPLSP